MPQVILTMGPPGIGKNTWARERVKKSKAGAIVVNRDDLRQMIVGGILQDYKFNKNLEKAITQMQFSSAEIAIQQGKDVIVADTNLNPTTIKAWEDFATLHLCTVEKKDFFKDFRREPANVEIEKERGVKGVLIAFRKLAHKRNLSRLNSVPPEVVDEFIDKYIVPAVYRPRIWTPTPGLIKALLVDLDGTTFHMNDGRGPYDWLQVEQDSPDQTVIETCRIYKAAGYAIVAASGRDGICREHSLRAMAAANMPCDEFFIRAEGDQRPDYIVKEEIFWNKVAPKYNIEFCLDDRDQVVQQYREMGLKVYQVAPGNF